MGKLFNAGQVQSASLGRDAQVADIGGGAGLVQAGQAVTEFGIAEAKAKARVAQRGDIIENARQDSLRSEWQRENSPAYINSDLTKKENMEEATQASLVYNSQQLSAYTGTSTGRADLEMDLQARHDSFLDTLATEANSQQIGLLDATAQGQTNAYAADAAANPGSWRDILGKGDVDLDKMVGVMNGGKLASASLTRAQTIMGAAFGTMVDNENYMGAFDMASSEEYRTLMTPDMQRDARVKINTSRNQKTGKMTAAEKAVHDYGVITGSGLPKHIQDALMTKTFGLAKTPRERVNDIMKTVTLTTEEESQLLVAFATDGKITDFGKDEPGKETAFENWADSMDVPDTTENRAKFKKLPAGVKAAYGGVSLPTDKIIPPTPQDLAFERGASFLGQGELTAEQMERGKMLGPDIDFNAMTLQDATRAYGIFNDGAEPSEEWLTRAAILYPVAEDQAFASKSVVAGANNNVLSIMNDYRDEDAVITPADAERFEASVRIMSIGTKDETGVFVPGTGITQSIRDFADRFDLEIPATHGALAGAPGDTAFAAGPSDSTPEGQSLGLWANVAEFKGPGQGLQNLAAGFFIRGKLSNAEKKVRNFRQKATVTRQKLIMSLRSEGGHPLSAERQELADTIATVLEPAFFQNPEALQVDIEALAESLAIHEEFAIKNSQPTGSNTGPERAAEMAIANDIRALLDVMGVPPIMTEAAEVKALPAGTKYYIRTAEGKKLKIRN